MARDRFILTNHPGREQSITWNRVSHEPGAQKVRRRGLLGDFFEAVALFLKRREFSVVVLGGGARTDLFYLILHRLCPFGGRPVVKLDCLWYEAKPFKQFLKGILFRWLDKGVSRYVVWAQREMADYSRVFRLPREKFCFVPYHTTIEADNYQPMRGNYIFSGGNFARDYATLALAVRGLDVRVIIACSNREAVEGINFPPNARVVGVDHQRFMELMAGSYINVVCLRKGLLHSGGQQTFLNAMALGKPVIVTDPEGARGYVEDGVDGLLVPPGDPLKLREAILKLLNNRQLADIMGHRGKFKASRLDTEAHLTAIARLARDVAQEAIMDMESRQPAAGQNNLRKTP